MFDPEQTRAARQDMVAGQLVPRGIRDPRVLRAMAAIPRERFVPDALAADAYRDGPLPLGCGQTISQPYMVAVMAEELQLTGTETVLEVGAGSGYGAAILSCLARRVIAVERIPELLDQAIGRWNALGLDNITGILGDGTLGAPEYAPFDGISVTAAAPGVPRSLFEQLRVATGRMTIPVGERFLQHLCLVRRKADGAMAMETRFGCVFVPLVGREGWAEPPAASGW
ncbi:MAG: protein-L-isoaspartate(D-aspartate) O-methyltransferase [Magnetococcales bacterium]|nr:protein-L-isoaspartate(D-aspartate) O-methyltransferase [Magnetococcales bacterium]